MQTSENNKTKKNVKKLKNYFCHIHQLSPYIEHTPSDPVARQVIEIKHEHFRNLCKLLKTKHVKYLRKNMEN